MNTHIITNPALDPFGTAMLDYFGGNLGATIQVFSDLAENDEIPVRYLFRSYSQMPNWEQKALEACYGEVLDIGAGAGSHTLHLQKIGMDVVAMDISPGAVDIMQSRGVENIIHGSIWDFTKRKFDTLLLLMNGIGLVGDLKGLNQFLGHAKSLLKPGGQILFDSSDIAYLYEKDNQEILNPDRYYGIISYQMCYGEVCGEIFDWLYIDYPRLEKHARVNGYTCEKLVEGGHYEYVASLKVKN